LSYAFIKRLTVIALPALLLVAAWAALGRIELLPAAQRELAFYAPYLALSAGLALSLAFNRGRVFLSLVLIGLFYLAARSFPLQGALDYVPRTLYLFFSLLLPVNLCLFCFMRERGVFSRAGKSRLGFLAAQALVVFWMVRYPQDYGAVAELIGTPLFGAGFLAGMTLPHWGFFFFLLAGVLIAIRALKRRYPIDVALLGTLIALAITLNRIESPFVPALFVTAAVLLLTIAVLQDSHSMAFSDDLTGLPSRRALNEQMMGLGGRYVVAMLDVDHFKRFNDTFGHDVGDQVLKMVGSKIAAIKGGGKPFRYGGEEFTIIFQRRDLQEVIPYLEELRQTIGSYQLWIRGSDRPKEAELGKAKRSGGTGSGKSVSVTVSIGVAAAAEDLRTPAEVIKAADRALYRAKQRGRNQVAS
jgi:diguanylate cyclase (GGDEF)-like protein